MSTRYDRVTVEYNVEFEGPGSFTIEPTDEQKADPRFVAFIEWTREIRLATIAADMASGPGNITLF